MSLPSLFLAESKQGDLSLTKLPQDMDLWAENIVSKIKEVLPQSKNCIIKITFLQKNEELGTATGAAALHNQKLGKTVYIPLIVKGFSLYPLDVMLLPKKNVEGGFETTPLTLENYDEAMMDNEVFSHLERPIDRIQQLYMNPQNSAIYPPTFRNVYASEGYPMLDAISGSISTEDKETLINTIKRDPGILIGYEKRAHLGALKKIANSVIDTKSGDKPVTNITLIKKDMGGQGIKLYSVSDEVFDPILEDVRSNEVRSSFSRLGGTPEETLNKVYRNGESIVTDKLKPQEDAMVWGHNDKNYTQTEETPIDPETFGAYKVQDKNGVFYKGIIFPVIINFNQKTVGAKLFVSPNKAGYQTKFAAIPTGTDAHQFLKYREPSIGMTGVFVTGNEKTHIATIPITIRSVSDDNSDVYRIVAMDMNGRTIKLRYKTNRCFVLPTQSDKEEKDRLFDTFDKLRNIVKARDHYIIPSSFNFLPLDRFGDFQENSDMVLKQAMAKIATANPIRVIYTGANQYALKGPDIKKMADKLAWDATNLTVGQTVFMLAAKKCPMSKVASALKYAGSWGEAKIHRLPPIVFEKKASVASKYVEDYIRGLRVNLVKEAANLEDGQVVDTALSLNFIRPSNIDKFVQMIPYFEECSKMLAQALLASRVGMTVIPEQATQSAMTKIVEVISGLKRLKSDSEE